MIVLLWETHLGRNSSHFHIKNKFISSYLTINEAAP